MFWIIILTFMSAIQGIYLAGNYVQDRNLHQAIGYAFFEKQISDNAHKIVAVYSKLEPAAVSSSQATFQSIFEPKIAFPQSTYGAWSYSPADAQQGTKAYVCFTPFEKQAKFLKTTSPTAGYGGIPQSRVSYGCGNSASGPISITIFLEPPTPSADSIKARYSELF